jgi:prophage DNA circulation protein
MAEPWKEALLTAQYGGAKFFYQSHTRSGGHRVNVIDYPESSQHDLEDMGPRNDSFQIAGYILGANYNTLRNQLLEQLKDSAAKELVVPSEGTFRVKCTDWSLNETKEEQRIARFNMSFQLQEVIEIITLISTKQDVLDKKATMLDRIDDWFEDVYEISQRPVNAVNDAVSTVDKALDVVRDAKNITGSVADFQRAIRELSGRTVALALNAQSLVQNMRIVVNFGTDPDNMGTNTDNADDISLGTTGNEQRIEARNIQSQMSSPLVPNSQEPSPLIQNMITMQAIAAESGLFAESDFDSPSAALAEERDLISRYDTLIDDLATAGTPVSDELYYAIRDLQHAVHEDLQQRIVRLPRLVTRQNDAERNALELNYSTYGNLSEYEPFNLRNGIIHPGFVPALLDLQYKVGTDE